MLKNKTEFCIMRDGILELIIFSFKLEGQVYFKGVKRFKEFQSFRKCFILIEFYILFTTVIVFILG